MAETIQITVQPQSQQATEGSRIVLSCRGSGPPGLNYQWFRGKDEVRPMSSEHVFTKKETSDVCCLDICCSSVFKVVTETGNMPELVLCPLTPLHQGHYICRVNHGEKCTFSQWAHVHLIRSSGSFLLSLLFAFSHVSLFVVTSL